MSQPQSVAAAQAYLAKQVARPCGRRGSQHGHIDSIATKIRDSDGTLVRGLFFHVRYDNGIEEYLTWKDLEGCLVFTGAPGRGAPQGKPLAKSAASARRPSRKDRAVITSSDSSDAGASSSEEEKSSDEDRAPCPTSAKRDTYSFDLSDVPTNSADTTDDCMPVDQQRKGRVSKHKPAAAAAAAAQKSSGRRGTDQDSFTPGKAAARLSAALHVRTPVERDQYRRSQRSSSSPACARHASSPVSKQPLFATPAKQQQQGGCTDERGSSQLVSTRRATRSAGTPLVPGLRYFTSTPVADAARQAAQPTTAARHLRSRRAASSGESSSSEAGGSRDGSSSSSEEEQVRQEQPRQQQRRQQLKQRDSPPVTTGRAAAAHGRPAAEASSSSSDEEDGNKTSSSDGSSSDEAPEPRGRLRRQPPASQQQQLKSSTRPTPSRATRAAAAGAMTPRPAAGRKAKLPAAATTPARTPAPAARRTRAAAPGGLPAAAAVATPFTAAASARGAGAAAATGLSASAPGTLRLGGEVFGPGDDVYLALPGFTWQEEQDEACEVCGSTQLLTGMLECSCCLRGFHLRCLQPPLKKVPEGDWLCPTCDAGEPAPRPAQLVTYWQKLLYGEDQLELAHVVGVTRGTCPKGNPEDQVLVRYYVRPEATHIGRQRHHGARELFLGTQVFVEPAYCIVRRAFVHAPAAFAAAADSEQGNDVFLCQYEYDQGWKRFRQRMYGQEGRAPGASSVSDWAWSGPSAQDRDFGFEDEEDASSDEDLYQPDTPAWVTRGGPGGRGRRRQGLKRPRQGGATAEGLFGMLGCSEAPQQAVPQDPFSKVLACLALSAVPAVLPGRETEKAAIRSFVDSVAAGEGGIKYICGVPGTGKTASVMEVLAAFQADQQLLEAGNSSGSSGGSQLVVLNCLQLPTPNHVFTRLWEKLTGQRMGPARAREALKQAFGVGLHPGMGRRRYSTMVVLDEIDMLLTRDQGVLYELFEWPQQPGSRLGIIGISNTHDLDERVLPRIKSRLSEAKLLFQPYQRPQLEAIIMERLETSGAVGLLDSAAVGFACTAVARQSGDARRALELLRRAVQLARSALPSAQQAALAASAGAGPSGTAAAGGASSHAAAGVGSSSSHKRHKAGSSNKAAAAAAATGPVWSPGQPALVTHQHVATANMEMANALHMQMLKGCSTWQLLLMVGMTVEARATGQLVVCLQAVAERVSGHLSTLVQVPAPSQGQLHSCAVQLAAQRLLVMQGSTIKCSLMLNVRKEDVATVVRDHDKLTRLHELM